MMRPIKTVKLPILVIGIWLSSTTYAQDSLKVRTILNVLASEQMQGRGYVNNGDAQAAMFIASNLMEIGITPLGESYFQPFAIPMNTFPGKMQVAIDNRPLKPVDQFIVTPISPSVKGKFKLVYLPEAADTNNTLYDSISAIDYSGKAVVAPWKKRSVSKQNALKASLVIVPRKELYWSVAGGDSVVSVPVIAVVDSLLKNVPKKVSVNIESVFNPSHVTQNIVAIMPGTTTPDSIIVFSAHYDHLGLMGQGNMFRGANDNASGCTMLIMLAEHFKKNPPKYSVCFMFFAAEEAGLIGSNVYVANPMFPLSQIKSLVNLDMVGTGSDGFALVNGQANPTIVNRFKHLNDSLQYFKSIQIRGISNNSDHAPFQNAGVPAVFIYTKGNEFKHYHTLYDNPEALPLTKFNELYRLLIGFVEL